jgi:hypothetical protein
MQQKPYASTPYASNAICKQCHMQAMPYASNAICKQCHMQDMYYYNRHYILLQYGIWLKLVTMTLERLP